VLKDEFRVVVRIWLGDDGRVQRTDIIASSGNAQTDELIQSTLLEMTPLKDVPPSSMRPMQLRLSNRS
jgi:periplasmic protein TonB